MARKAATRTPSKRKLAAAFHTIGKKPPKILAKTARKFGKARANKQRIAIAFSKASHKARR